MKIKLLISRADATGAQNRGDVVDVSPEEAQRMVDAEQAEIVRSAAPEKAVKRSKAEKAVR